MQIFDIDECEKRIGYTFKDKMLLRKCLTHSSYAYENGGGDNEVLEFFGDAIIEFVVTEFLYKNSFGDEGQLTLHRAEIVSREPLLKAFEKLDLAQFVLLGRGQKKSNLKENKLFSSVYEAIVAGIYLDGGITPAKKFITNTIIKDYKEKVKKSGRQRVKFSNEAKSRFQEYVAKNKLGSIAYEVVGKSGPEHKPEFRVVATLNGTKIAEGTASTKRSAEAMSAEKALKKLKDKVVKNK